MTINAPAVVLLAFYVAVGRAAGRRRPRSCAARSRTTCSRSSSRRRSGSAPSAVTCASSATCSCTARARMPLWNTISISGYHIREAGATGGAGAGVHARRRHRLRASSGSDAGLDVDEFAPRLSFFWDVHNDFFEEIAKFRAARRMWAQHHARALRREEPALVDAAHARADRGRVADGAAAAQQRRAHDAAGAGGGARRHAVAAHEQLRRDATRCRPRRRRRWRCARSRSSPRSRGVAGRGRSARRQLLRRDADRSDARPRRGDYIEKIDAMGGIVQRGRGGLSAARDRARRRIEFQREVDSGERAIVGVNSTSTDRGRRRSRP